MKLRIFAMVAMVAIGAFGLAAAIFPVPDAVAANTKVEICHIPPGNPANFHTIKISQAALPAHGNHGDYIDGPCSETCAELCDDGDACTMDDDGLDCEALGCAPGGPVDCDDSDPGTIDSCDPTDGCIYTVGCPCFDPAKLSVIVAPHNICSIDGTSGNVDDRIECGPEDTGAKASVTVSPGSSVCTYVRLDKDPSGGCVITESIINQSIADAEAEACLALLDATFDCP